MTGGHLLPIPSNPGALPSHVEKEGIDKDSMRDATNNACRCGFKKTKVQSLKSDFENIRMKKNEVDNYYHCLHCKKPLESLSRDSF